MTIDPRDVPVVDGVHLEPHSEKDHLVVCWVVLSDPELIGHSAELTVDRVVRVKDDRPVDGRETVWEQEFEIDGREHRFTIPRSRFGNGYSYEGRQIAIRIESKLTVDDALLFDTEIEGTHGLRILDRPTVDGNAEELAEPADAFDFFENFTAIPAGAKSLTLLLGLLGGLLVVASAVVGIHDQFVPESATWLFSHVDADGEAQSPLMAGLGGSFLLGVGAWYLLREQLRRYMTFRFAPGIPDDLHRETTIPARDLVRGRPHVALENVVFRVVAYNVEMGQYQRGSGTDRRTVSFVEPVRAHLLHVEVLDHVPKGKPIQYALEGEVAFRKLFTSLYPPLKVGEAHGISVRWEAQLLHPDFIDQELIREVDDLPYERFLAA